MQKSKLGNTGLMVLAVGMGCMNLSFKTGNEGLAGNDQYELTTL